MTAEMMGAQSATRPMVGAKRDNAATETCMSDPLNFETANQKTRQFWPCNLLVAGLYTHVWGSAQAAAVAIPCGTNATRKVPRNPLITHGFASLFSHSEMCRNQRLQVAATRLSALPARNAS